MESELIYDIPKTKGEENTILRAKQLAYQKWTPYWKCDLDGPFLYPLRNGEENDVEYTGYPYSSVRVEDKFVGIDISFDTFLSAVDNPISEVYTRNVGDFYDKDYNCTIKNVRFAYGHVCSTFVAYALDLPMHRSTREIGTADEFYEILPRCADSLKLCDTLVTTRPDGITGGHIRIVTGIGRNKDGNVEKIEISEGYSPFPKSEWYTKEEFENTLFGIGHESGEKSTYKIYRYKYVENVGAPETFTETKNSQIMLNRGNFSNYHKNETIEFNINCDADKLVIVGRKNTIEVDKSEFYDKEYFGRYYKVYSISNLECDFYSAYLVKDDQPTKKVNFIVAKAPDVVIVRENDEEFEKVELIPLDTDGSPLTKTSSCLYEEDKTLKKGVVNIELYDGTRTIPACASVREKDGKLIMRTAMKFKSENDECTNTFVIGEKTNLFAYKAKVGDIVKIRFSDYENLEPLHISWKEEWSIAFSQRLLTAEEKDKNELMSVITKHYNHFLSFQICCENEYGIQATEPICFVL